MIKIKTKLKVKIKNGKIHSNVCKIIEALFDLKGHILDVCSYLSFPATCEKYEIYCNTVNWTTPEHRTSEQEGGVNN